MSVTTVATVDWPNLQLKYVARLAYGDSLPSESRIPGKVSVLGSNGPVGFHHKANTLGPCIVVGRKGSYGKITYSDAPVFAIDTTYYIDSRHTRTNLRWLYYLLGSIGLDSISQDTGVPGLSREHAYCNRVHVPSESEQKAIADFLDRKTTEIDGLIGRKQRLIDLLGEKRKSLISHAVTKGLNSDAPMKDSGFPGLDEVPRHWRKVRVKHVMTFMTSGSRGWAEYYSDEGDLFIQSGNLNRKLGLDLSNVQHVQPPVGAETARTRIRQWDVLVCVTGAYTGNVGLVDSEIPIAYVNQHVALVRPAIKMVCPSFLALVLHSQFGSSQFDMTQYGGTKQGLGLEDIREVVLYLPPRVEQEEISSHVAEQMRGIELINAKLLSQIEKLQEYRRTLISTAVTGKLDVSKEMIS